MTNGMPKGAPLMRRPLRCGFLPYFNKPISKARMSTTATRSRADGVTGPEELARGLVVALDEALVGRPLEGRSRPRARVGAVQERRQVASRGVNLIRGGAQAGEDGDQLLEADVVVRGEVLRPVIEDEARDDAAFHGPVGGGGVVMEIMIREELCT